MKKFKKMILLFIILIITFFSVMVTYLSIDDVEIKDVPGSAIIRDEENFFIKLPGKKPDGYTVNNIDKDTSGPAMEEPDDESDDKASVEISWEHSGPYCDIDRLILVNRDHPLDADFVPADLVRPDSCAADRNAGNQYLTREACDAFNKLTADALLEGNEIVLTTAYRSYEVQKYLYDGYVNRDGQVVADTYSARPGTSEHQTGLAADVSSPSVGYRLVEEYADTEEGQWLAQNCYKYGFIIRFPKGKEDITGYMYEPWHIRYVGTSAASEIFRAGITFEEYMGEK